MSQVITNRVRLSRRALLKGLTAAGAPIVVGLPPLVSMFNSQGTAYAAGSRRRRGEGRSRAASSSGSTATASPSGTGFRPKKARDYRHDAVPLAAGAVPQRHSRAQRRGQRGRRRNGQRPHQLDERPDDRHAVSPDADRADRPSTR